MVDFLAIAGALVIFVLASRKKLDPLIHALVVGSPKAVK